MVPLSAFFLSAVFNSVDERTAHVSTRDELIGFITACATELRDLEANFEIQRTDLIPDQRPGGYGDSTATGIYRFRQDGRQYMSVSEDCDTRGHKEETIALDGKVQERLASRRLTINRDHFGSTQNFGRPGSLFALQSLSTVWRKHLASSAEVNGVETLNGRKCLKFVFSASPFRPDGSHAAVGDGRDAFVWLDLERGGCVAQWEYYVKGRLQARRTFEFAKHSGIWLPVLCEKKSFVTPDLGERRQPTLVYTSKIDLSTAKVNQGLPDSAFAIDPPPGTYVNDMLNDKRYRVGGTPPPVPRGVAKRNLDTLIKDAKSDDDGLRSDDLESDARSTGLFAYVALLLGGVLLAIGIAIRVRQGAQR